MTHTIDSLCADGARKHDGRRRNAALVALLVAAGGALGAPAADAAPRECGRLVSSLAYNITTSNVSCGEARRVVRAWSAGPAQGRGNRARGLRCRYRDIAYEAGDIRCTGSRGRVVRWQTAS
jgi:hypothetical protein